MPALSAHLLGSLDFRTDVDDAEPPTAQKAQELLCYLLLHRGRPIRRDLLSAQLWADADPRQCRKNLRQALWQLQTAMGQSTSAAVLEVAAQTVKIQNTADVWLDVAEFQSEAEDIRGCPAHRLGAAEAALADRAIRLYQGDLLEGFDFDWCLVEREWLKSTFLMLLDRLMSYCEANRQYDRGVEYGELILRHDRAREYTHRHLMHLHHLRGDRTSALRQYARCAEALHEELGLSPEAATIRLREQIHGECQVDFLGGAHGSRLIRLPSGAVIGECLLRLQRELAAFQRQLSAEIRALEPAAANAIASEVVARREAADRRVMQP